ncbi:MAG: hypothetical protein QCH96_00820 [Candidatus Thermoplasmatota archaeon]|nr:hypothetical protein [Candidatus Thermoplasmatota archaeon]
MKLANLTILSIIVFLLLSGSSYTVADQPFDHTEMTEYRTSQYKWFHQPQVYNMVAFSPDDAQQYHISINGLWNGFIGDNLSSPFAFGRLIESITSGRIYQSDKEFVDAHHEQGLMVPSTILTIQGHRSFQEGMFDEFASRSIDGELCPWDVEADSYWMNSLHPGFIDWCIQHGKKAIDAGADIIVLDEIEGNGLVTLMQWASQYTGNPAPGFSDITINGFRDYLKSTYSFQELWERFLIEDIETVDLKDRIAQTMTLVYDERIRSDPLIEDYHHFLITSNFEAKKHLIRSLRDYAIQQNKDIVISANSYTLGTNQAFGFWSKGLIFADLIDFFTFENTYTAIADQPIPKFYRTKWLAWERLAYAATKAPGAILIDTSTLKAINERVFPLFGFSNSLGVLCAEAYANKASFVNYHIPLIFKERNWNKVETIQDFVMKNSKYYDYSSSVYGNVGIVFLFGDGMRNHTDTYLGCAQALAESQIPFEVVFDGDGFYLKSDLCLRDIQEFPLIIVPSLLSVSEDQKNVIKEYVAEGGIALIFDGDELGFQDIAGPLPYGEGQFYVFEEDYGKLYFKTYMETYSKSITDCVNQYTSRILSVNKDGRKLIITPYLQENNSRLVLHLVNYDHIGFFDFTWPLSNINITLRKPGFHIQNVTLLTPTSQSINLPFISSDDTINITVPFQREYSIIVMT